MIVGEGNEEAGSIEWLLATAREEGKKIKLELELVAPIIHFSMFRSFGNNIRNG